MANNEKKKGIVLDGKTSVNCPYCGNSNRINDLLFRTSKLLLAAEDNRLSNYYYRLYHFIPQSHQIREGWTEPRRLISWAEMPNSKVTVKDGFVVAVEDYDGEKTEERACVWCHNKISDEWISRAGREIAIFGQPGAERQAGEFIGRLLGKNDKAHKTYNELRCFIYGEQVIYNCINVSDLDVERKRRAVLNGISSDAVVFFLKLEPLDGKEQVMDLNTVEWLRDGISDVYGSSVINCPTLIILIPAPGDRIDNFEMTHKVLFTRLKVHFSNYRTCFWQSAEQSARELSETIEWLLGNN